MAKQQTNAKTSLIVKLTEQNPKIIQNWPKHEKRTINSFCNIPLRDFTETDFKELDIKLIRLQPFVGVSRLLGDVGMEDLLKYLATLQTLEQGKLATRLGRLFPVN